MTRVAAGDFLNNTVKVYSEPVTQTLESTFQTMTALPQIPAWPNARYNIVDFSGNNKTDAQPDLSVTFTTSGTTLTDVAPVVAGGNTDSIWTSTDSVMFTTHQDNTQLITNDTTNLVGYTLNAFTGTRQGDNALIFQWTKTSDGVVSEIYVRNYDAVQVSVTSVTITGDNEGASLANTAVAYGSDGSINGVSLQLESGYSIAPITSGISASLTNAVASQLGVKPMNVQLTTAGLESISNVFALLSPLRYYITSSSSDLRFDVVPITAGQLVASKNPAEYVPSQTEDGLGSTLPTTGDVRHHRNDGLNACPFLHMNRWDYRACVGQADEAEPLKRFRLKLANEPRWHADLESQGLYFRGGVQAPLHFPRVPRKGIYAYSFATDAEKDDEGFSHLGKLHNKKIEVDVNKAESTLARLHLFSEGLNVFECDPRAGTARFLHKRGGD